MAPDVTDERVTNLLGDPDLSRSSESTPKIQLVQPYLREREKFQKNYSPKLLSIGPIHHGHQNLKLGEHYKQRWTKAYFNNFKLGKTETKAAAQRLHQNIASKIEDFKKRYSEDAIKEYKGNDRDLIWMLFVDGCSILHVMNIADIWGNEASDALGIKIDQLALLLQDMLLLENQLPYELLVLLTGDEDMTKQSMLKLLQHHGMVRGVPQMVRKPNIANTNNDSHEIEIDVGPPPAHLLDLLHKILLPSTPSPPQKPQTGPSTPFSPPQKPTGPSTPSSPSQKPQLRFNLPDELHHLLQILDLSPAQIRNIQELKAAGISVKRSKRVGIEAVNFKHKRRVLWASGDLELPEIIVDDFTAPTFMNLIAYEMCPDFHNNFYISSYVAFLDTLIDHPDDVKELRWAGVLKNYLGNDEEVAQLFNTISTDLIADTTTYAHVSDQIKKHCNSKWNTWMASLKSEYFSTPWTTIAVLTAAIVTLMTGVQTWFAINSPQ